MNLNLHRNLGREFMGTSLPVLTRHAISPARTACPSPIQSRSHPCGLTIFDQELIPPRIDPRRVPLLSLPIGLFSRRPLLFILSQSRLIPHIPLRCRQEVVQLILLVGNQMWMGDAGIRGFQDRSLMSRLADYLDRGVFPGLHALAALPNVPFVRQARSTGEDAASIDSVELTGFGGWIEELGKCHTVDWEIVDRLMGFGSWS